MEFPAGEDGGEGDVGLLGVRVCREEGVEAGEETAGGGGGGAPGAVPRDLPFFLADLSMNASIDLS